MAARQTKSTQNRHERLLLEIIKQPGNNVCVDCRAKNPRWASHNLGVFLCIRCGGLHRRMGTHISKVKSVSMDSWTMEQIESIRASGGNDAVNQKYNPHPERHPLPLADDDHGMERYIRNKWEKKSFMDPPAPQAESATTSIRASSAASIPQRSSSVPGVVRDSDISRGLATLHDMGFRDQEQNRRVLSQTKGNLESTVEILSRLPGQQQSIAAQPKDHMTEQQKFSKLWSLGYKDESKCRDALRRTGGNLEVAIEILAKEASERSLPQLPTSTANSLVDVSDNVFTPQPVMNPYQAQVQQMAMQQQQQQQPQLQAPSNPFGTSFITASQPNAMLQNASMTAYPFGMNQAQPQVQPQLTGFNQPVMGQFQPMQQQQQQPSFTSNPFSQMVTSASTPTNSFAGVNPFNQSQPKNLGFAYNPQQPVPQPSPMNQPHTMPTRSYTSPDFNNQSSNHFFSRSNSATEFQTGSGLVQGQNPFF